MLFKNVVSYIFSMDNFRASKAKDKSRQNQYIEALILISLIVKHITDNYHDQSKYNRMLETFSRPEILNNCMK